MVVAKCLKTSIMDNKIIFNNKLVINLIKICIESWPEYSDNLKMKWLEKVNSVNMQFNLEINC